MCQVRQYLARAEEITYCRGFKELEDGNITRSKKWKGQSFQEKVKHEQLRKTPLPVGALIVFFTDGGGEQRINSTIIK